MLLCRVVGTVVATAKDEGLEGLKLLVTQVVGLDMQLKNSFVVAADGVGAGMGELVIVVQGSSARMATRVKNKPLDATIVGIVDAVEVGGEVIFRKETEEQFSRV
ncbi:EutN/CcmL family microcompartment protein [Candidatus Poribacteria bacterium]|nr:EutN/CcmL family microcompartment protein [Candidatus Poribacteria bacterium]